MSNTPSLRPKPEQQPEYGVAPVVALVVDPFWDSVIMEVLVIQMDYIYIKFYFLQCAQRH